MTETYIQPLIGRTGRGGLNFPADVAIVQAALKLIKRRDGAPFYNGSIDGRSNGALCDAILTFQSENLNLLQRMTDGIGNDGSVGRDSETFHAMQRKLPASKPLAAMPNFHVVYRPATEGDLASALAAVDRETKMLPEFRRQLKQLSTIMFNKHRLVLSVAPRCGYRTFDDQLNIEPTNTNAGPGESAHNWGIGCDFGFYKFAFLSDTGEWVEDAPPLQPYLEKLRQKGLSDPFWALRNFYFQTHGLSLHPSGKVGDKIHVQSMSDARAAWTTSLCDLMDREASSYWDRKSGQYYSSMVFSEEPNWPVGTAKAIWTNSASIAPASLAAALEQGRRLRASIGTLPDALEGFYQGFAADRDDAKSWTAADITGAHIAQMRNSLRQDFEVAQRNYLKWQARG